MRPLPMAAARIRYSVLAGLLCAAPLTAQLTIVTSTVPDAVLGQPYPAVNIETSGAHGPVTWSFVNTPFPPPGFVVGRSAENNTAGTFCYGATAGGENPPVCTGAVQGFGSFYNFVLRADDGVTSVQRTFTFELQNPLRITTEELPAVAAGEPFSAQLTVAGGTGSYIWQVVGGSLPSGLTLDGATGLLSGTATSLGASYFFTVRVTETNSGSFATRKLVFNVLGTQQITTSDLPLTILNQTMTPFSLQATGGQNYVWSVPDGWTLPPGLALSAPGVLSGTPTVAGSYRFPIQVLSTTQAEPVAKYFSLHVTLGPLSIVQTDLPAALVGLPYQTTLTRSGGLPPFIWAFDTAATQGMLINPNTGTITGTPLNNGSIPLPVALTDATGTRIVRPFTLVVAGPLAVFTAALPNANHGVPYNQVLSASGGQPPYRWSIASGSLPAGLTLDAVAGRIEGVPTAEGVFPFGLAVTDFALQRATRQMSITVVSNITILTTALASGITGASYSQALVAAGAQGAVTWSVTGGALPAGLTLNPTIGVISGTPSAEGTANFTIRASDNSTAAERVFSINILAPLTISTATLPNGPSGVAYAQLLTAAGGQPPYTWSVSSGALPGGLTLDTVAGRIAGVPTASGVFPFGITVTDAALRTSTRQVSITVVGGITIVTSALADGITGSPYSQTLTSTGAQGAVTWSVIGGALPTGLTLNASTGLISGSPTAAGTSIFTIRATDGVSTPAERALSIHVQAALVISTTSLADGITGSPYSQTLTSTGAQGAVTWSVIGGALPTGLTLNAATGAIAGSPTAGGTFHFTIRAAAGLSTPGERAFSITIYLPLSIVTGSLPNGARGAAYSQLLAASGGKTPYTWSTFTGALPTGLTLSAGGVIGGTPTAAGTFQFQVSVTDSGPQAALASFSITIAESLTITTGNLSGTLGTAFSQTLAASGGAAPYTWAITSGALPAGLQLNGATGAITGTPTAPGSFNATFRATDQAQVTASAQLTVTINATPLPAVSFGSLPDSSPAARQPSVSVNLASGYPANLTGTLTLTFASSVGGDDQTVQFSTGSRTLNFAIPAGATQATFAGGTPAVLTGTVAGTITITPQFSSGEQNVTPSPAPVKTIAVELAAPVISTVTLQRTGSTLTVVVNGYATSREMVSGTYRFSATGGNTLAQPDVVVQLGTAFTTWFGGAASNATGGQFRLTLPFTIQGDAAAVNLASVTLTNTRGSSAAGAP